MLTRRLHEIREAEKEAERVYRAARQEANRILLEASEQAEAELERAKAEARREADRVLARARTVAARKREVYGESCAEEIRQLEASANRRLDRAVDIAFDWVVSRWVSNAA